jgi:hypothetical protein
MITSSTLKNDNIPAFKNDNIQDFKTDNIYTQKMKTSLFGSARSIFIGRGLPAEREIGKRETK